MRGKPRYVSKVLVGSLDEKTSPVAGTAEGEWCCFQMLTASKGLGSPLHGS